VLVGSIRKQTRRKEEMAANQFKGRKIANGIRVGIPQNSGTPRKRAAESLKRPSSQARGRSHPPILRLGASPLFRFARRKVRQ
jgi:hypothetical protein